MNVNKRQILRYSPAALAAYVIVKKLSFHLTKDEQFEHRMKLVFPHYNQDANDEGK